MSATTKYVGIHRVEDKGHWWIQSDDGCELYFGTIRPTDDDVDAYAAPYRA